MKKIVDIAKNIGISETDCYNYGPYITKIRPFNLEQKGKLVLVTAITPTPAGEGKTTTSIGLGDALEKIGKKTIICLREPSMGPVFGLKGGATGGGAHKVVPTDDINLHFTGDMHAITSANNLICAVIDSIIFHGNDLNIDPQQIFLHRIIDMNDRALRDVIINAHSNDAREEHFEITVASELMAILCLSIDENDFEQRVLAMHVANTFDNQPIYVRDLNIIGSIMSIMKYALHPNLVQTLEETPVLIHGGPFANIAHGCNSIIATNTALSLADVVVTEAGFGSDLGFEKFLDIKSRVASIDINCVVLVATIRALKMHGGVSLEELDQENLDAIKLGFANLVRHMTNISRSGINVVVNLNVFEADTNKELELFKLLCTEHHYQYAISDGYNKGSDGVLDLANLVVSNIDQNEKNYNYNLEDDIETKLEKIVKNVYGGSGIQLSEKAKQQTQAINQTIAKNLPICIAKTPNSFTDNSKILNAPDNFIIHFDNFKVNYGAGFIVCYANKIMTLPGLGKKSQVYNIKYDSGVISNLT